MKIKVSFSMSEDEKECWKLTGLVILCMGVSIVIMLAMSHISCTII
jgi:hypothetical protein